MQHGWDWVRKRGRAVCGFARVFLWWKAVRVCCQGPSPWQPGLYFTHLLKREFERGPWLLTSCQTHVYTHKHCLLHELFHTHTANSFILFIWLNQLETHFTEVTKPVDVALKLCAVFVSAVQEHLACGMKTTGTQGHGKQHVSVRVCVLGGTQVCLVLSVWKHVNVVPAEPFSTSDLSPYFSRTKSRSQRQPQQRHNAQKAGWTDEWMGDALSA